MSKIGPCPSAMGAIIVADRTPGSLVMRIGMHRFFWIVIVGLCAAGQALAEEGEPSPLACESFRVEAKRTLDQAPDTLQVNTLFFSAARKGCTSSIDELMQAGASFDARDRDGDTPVGVAAKAGRSSFVAELLRRGAKIDGSDAGSTTRRSTVHLPAPIIRAARMRLRSTSRAPCAVLTTIG